ncbi:MAG: type I DNA topoisomerase [Oscillospiraceae bacterium]|jgi:DNA topoisomerase-1|nr:type I DNA topoisomerase [Oscillospiraceae bacterium]
MAKKTENLVIVESPAKAKTIEKYLGPGYTVTASMGHLRDLPKSTMGVDIERNFAPEYTSVKGREALIGSLRSAAKSAGTVFLATDPDREGEAISWHLKELLGLSDEKAKRVTFNEITKKVVLDAITHPRALDMGLVDAQQARRVLDRLVGYELSPFIWKKIKYGLSAGRVQSAALRIVVDREEEIRAFIPEEYWLLEANLLPDGGAAVVTAKYFGRNGKKEELHSEAEVLAIIAATEKAPFIVTGVKHTERQRRPQPPFTTSSLQQAATNRLGMTPKKCMAVAQMLYEGIDIDGEGTVGLITYMRTDSLRLSEDALSDAARFIPATYGQENYPGQPTRYKAKAGAQDAHEAIRPSNVFLTPEKVRKSLTSDQYKLYRLIWARFVASQMSPARYAGTAIGFDNSGYEFRATHSHLIFRGYLTVYADDEESIAGAALPELPEGGICRLDKFIKEQKFTQPPARYTESSLIREMEETGIGRPSTYAPTIGTITSREYVVKEGRTLRPTPLGEVITALLKERFSDIVNLQFTANMEERFDEIESGKEVWTDVISGFYGGFHKSIETAETEMDGQRIKVPDEVSDEVCDVCGKPMVFKSGKFGRFLGCSGFPDCTFTKPIVVKMPGVCPNCGGELFKRTSKTGHAYYSCDKRVEEGKFCFITWDVPVADNCPICGKTMFKPSGKGAKKPYCINADCPEFVPEDKRGWRKKTSTDGAAADKKPAARTASAKKPAAKTKTATAKKSAAKLSTAPKNTVKKANTAKRSSKDKNAAALSALGK